MQQSDNRSLGFSHHQMMMGMNCTWSNIIPGITTPGISDETRRIARPSSPRGFFARIYGNLEKPSSENNRHFPETTTTTTTTPIYSGINERALDVTNAMSTRINTVKSIDSDDDENHEFLKKIQKEDARKIVKTVDGAPTKKPAAAVRVPAIFTRPTRGGGSLINNNNTNLAMFNLAAGSVSAGTSVIPSTSLRDHLTTHHHHHHRGHPPPLIETHSSDAKVHFYGFSAFLARRRRKENRPRRQRTTFSEQQTACLELEYHRGEYISRGRRFELAVSLNLTETQIKIWFQNRRAKDKRIEKAQLDQHYRNLVASNGLQNFSLYTSVEGDSIHKLCVCKNNGIDRYTPCNCLTSAMAQRAITLSSATALDHQACTEHHDNNLNIIRSKINGGNSSSRSSLISSHSRGSSEDPETDVLPMFTSLSSV